MRLLETMEAERELPPLLRMAFARDGPAYEGWQKMSIARRRGHLMGIFYYRDPVSRQRRAAKALEDARRLAQKG
ncbi:MAG: YdeI/OmpD-associated family protein [Bryobacteraceae bacterium]